jgi:hypothetical protein
VHHRAAEHTNTWGLPFPFLITHVLRKKWIKGNAIDRPITVSPYFGCIQWNQSLSHMPRATPDPEPEPKPMEISEMAAEQEIAAEPKRVTEQEEQPEGEEEEEYKETIMLRASDFVHFQDILEDMRFQIADLQRTEREDRLETQEMLRAILDRLPPASGPSAPPAP